MSRKEKLIARFKTRPRDFTWDELVRLLHYLGYGEITAGKTSGSRYRFMDESSHKLKFHRPHSDSAVKMYVIDDLIEKLKQVGKI
jgi:hypothetical protein